MEWRITQDIGRMLVLLRVTSYMVQIEAVKMAWAVRFYIAMYLNK